jgi:hypothetical protein
VLGFATPEELTALVEPLGMALREIALTPEALGKVDPSMTADYNADAIAAGYAAIFERVLR